MAIIERVVASGVGYSIALVLDDVAKTLTGLHGVNNTGKAITLELMTNGVTRDRVLSAFANTTIVLPQARPYTEPLWTRGGIGVDVVGLDSYGLSA